MTVDIDIDAEGLRALERGIEAMAENAEFLLPLGPRLVRRTTASEDRLFAEAPWAPRKASTIDRYQRPLRSYADEQLHTAEGDGPLDRLGVLRRTLTTPGHPGQRAIITVVPGGMTVQFGVRSTGPAFYAHFQRGAGARRPRDPFRFDTIAHDAATADVVDHIVSGFGDA